MDEIAGLVAESIARRAKAAQAQARARLVAQAQAGDPRAKQTLARVTAASAANAAKRAPSPVAPSRPPAPAAPPAPPVARVAPPATVLPVDGLPGLPLTIFDDDAVARPELLKSFSGTGLLAGIVLSEALALPVALREGGQGSNF